MYDPTIGRWTTEDPDGFVAADANLFRYVRNNPTNLVDPSGLFAQKYICIKEAEPHQEKYNVRSTEGRRPISVFRKKYKNQIFELNGMKYIGDIEVDIGIERRWSTFYGDNTPENFAAFVWMETNYTNVRKIVDTQQVKVPDIAVNNVIGMSPGVFIAPTGEDYGKSFKPSSFATLGQEFMEGFYKLPKGHPEDQKKK